MKNIYLAKLDVFENGEFYESILVDVVFESKE